MCLTPVKLKNVKDKQGIIRSNGGAVVPCGKCPQCKNRRVNSWIFRLLKQERVQQNSVFVTLTYSPENVPMTENGFMTLRKKDVQLFFKRLRKNTGCKTIKYYVAGEYGDDSWRPHYHAIIFDASKDDIDKAWGLGHIDCGQVTGASIRYTAKYICKEKRIPVHAKDDRVQEFSLMSLRLGSNYLTDEIVNWHKQNQLSYVILEGGFKQALPRYYRDKIFTEEEKAKINDKVQQQKHIKFEKDVKEAGGTKNFYRNRFYAINHALKNNNTLKRNKI